MMDDVKRLAQNCREWHKVFCIFGKGGISHVEALKETADLIESLAAELEQVKRERDGLNILLAQAQSMLETRTRERDAAVQDLNMSCPCEVCARSCQYDKVNPYDECADFMWRGVKED